MTRSQIEFYIYNIKFGFLKKRPLKFDEIFHLILRCKFHIKWKLFVKCSWPSQKNWTVTKISKTMASILSIFTTHPTTVRGRRYVTSRSAKSFKVMTAATPSLPGYLFSMFLNHFVYTIYLLYIFLCTNYSSVLTPYSLPINFN